MTTQPNSDRFASSGMAFTSLFTLMGVALLGEIIFALQAQGWRNVLSVVGVLLMASMAALVTGILVGFLFGVPRTDQPSGDDSPSRLRGVRNSSYRANTNLESISDWLTKILVGLGLTQIRELPEMLKTLGAVIASGLGAPVNNAAFSGALPLPFAISGFFLGWLYARLYLRSAMLLADQDPDPILTKASVVVDEMAAQLPDEKAQRIRVLQGNMDRLAAQALDENAGHDRFRDLSVEYENLRRLLPSSGERTQKMSEIVARVRALTLRLHPSADELRKSFRTEREGDRIVALAALQAVPDEGLLDIALDAIERSRSAFEQFVALRAVQAMVPKFSDTSKEQVRVALENQCKPTGRIDEQRSPDRWALSRQILRAISP